MTEPYRRRSPNADHTVALDMRWCRMKLEAMPRTRPRSAKRRRHRLRMRQGPLDSSAAREALSLVRHAPSGTWRPRGSWASSKLVLRADWTRGEGAEAKLEILQEGSGHQVAGPALDFPAQVGRRLVRLWNTSACLVAPCLGPRLPRPSSAGAVTAARGDRSRQVRN